MANAKVIVIPEGKICDYVDGKFRNDTPEEYVRQTIEKRLVNEHKYLPKQIRIEYTLQLGSRKPRADIVIFDKDCTEQTQENIKIIIECKKEAVEARNAKDGVEQLKSYMSACPNCEWGMWTNGRQKEVYRKYVNEKGQIDFMDYNDIPSADGNLDDINRPKRTTLKNAYDDNLLFTFKTCHNHIYVNDGLQKQPAFFELLKVIFCKIEDERNIPKPLEFYATSEERSNPDGQLTVKKRISKIFEQVKNKRKYKLIFDANDEIKLSPRSLAYIVSELQKYSLLNTNIDINGWLYHRIRMCIWKQWKKPRTKYKNLVKLGIPEHYASTIANSRRKYWYISNNKAVIWALNKERLINSGFYDLATAYQSVHVNY